MPNPNGNASRPVKAPIDGLAAAIVRIDQLESKVLEGAMAAGQGDGILLKKIDELQATLKIHQDKIQTLLERIDMAETGAERMHERLAAVECKAQDLQKCVDSLAPRIEKLEGK